MTPDEIHELTATVHAIVRLIPRGRATHYGAIARAAGRPGHARLVGRIMAGGSPGGLPAHRVVNARGELSGREAFDTPQRMRELLEAEGVAVRRNRIVDWRRVFWDPMEEV